MSRIKNGLVTAVQRPDPDRARLPGLTIADELDRLDAALNTAEVALAVGRAAAQAARARLAELGSLGESGSSRRRRKSEGPRARRASDGVQV